MARSVDMLVLIAVFDGYTRVGATRATSEPEICASQQTYDPTTAPLGTPRFGQPLGIHFTR